RLPMLTRIDLLDRAGELRARRLPPGARIAGRFSSSGSTGRRTQVLMTQEANAMFTLLLQRRYRWARFDPAGLFAEVRLPGMLPRLGDGSSCPPDEVLQ